MNGFDQTHKVVRFATVFLLILSSALASQEPASRNAPEHSDMAGCYELSMGRWWPWGFGEDAQFVTPPERIELLAKQGTDGWERGHPLVRALPNTSGRRGSSFWEMRPDDHIELVWTDGFTGVTLELKKRENTFRGWAHPHFDSFHLIKRVAHAKMHKIVCGANP